MHPANHDRHHEEKRNRTKNIKCKNIKNKLKKKEVHLNEDWRMCRAAIVNNRRS